MKVYLDNAATTFTDKRVVESMIPYMCDIYGNASSLHNFGREAASAVDEARAKIAKIFNAKPKEIYFTSGGTESDNWALRGIAYANRKFGNHIISTSIEHPAVMQTLKKLEKEGFEVTYLPTDSDGLVSFDDFKKAVKEGTFFASVMFANNETGAIQPIKEIGSFCKEHGIIFHTDAVQAISSIPIDVNEYGIDLLSLSAHKFHGPKGIGLLYVRSGIKIEKLIVGGHQERTYRAGTTNTPGVVGMAKALELCAEEMAENNKKIKELRDYFVKRVTEEIPFCHINGGMEKRLVGNANMSFDYIEGESILMTLDMKGIAVGTGSACSSGSLEPSYVILALGAPLEVAHSSIRFSFGRDNTKEQVDYVIESLRETVEKLRSWSPLFKEIKGESYNV